MKTKNNEKLKRLSFSELYDIFNFMKYELEICDESDKDIIKSRIEAIEEELKCFINNLF